MEKRHIVVTNKASCTGCRACEQLCPAKCIEMKEDEEGFIYPHIDETKCINCGLCKMQCPQLKTERMNHEKEVFAVKAKDKQVAHKSTSAGVAYLLSKKTIEENGIVYGCAYNEKLEPNQIRVTNKQDLEKLRGSKYVFSNTLDTFTKAKKDLEEGKKVLYIGTPCQIAGLYAFLRKEYENLLTIDIVCHGVPSTKLFKKYIEYLEEKYKAKIENYEFRNKDKAIWGEFFAKVTMQNNKVKYINADEDPYYSNFLKGTIYRECCYECKYADMNRVGDITLADFWGIEKENIHFYEKEGVSLVIVNTSKGKRNFEEIKNDIDWEKHTEEQASRRNGNLSHPTKRTEQRNKIYTRIDELPAKQFMKENMKIQGRVKKKIKRMIPKNIKKMIKKYI